MVRNDGEAKVGDFGAAYNYSPLGKATAPLVERVEVPNPNPNPNP